MRNNIYETLYEEVIETLQSVGGEFTVSSLIETVLAKHPTHEFKIRELIWYLISNNKLVYQNRETVALAAPSRR